MREQQLEQTRTHLEKQCSKTENPRVGGSIPSLATSLYINQQHSRHLELYDGGVSNRWPANKPLATGTDYLERSLAFFELRRLGPAHRWSPSVPKARPSSVVDTRASTGAPRQGAADGQE